MIHNPHVSSLIIYLPFPLITFNLTSTIQLVKAAEDDSSAYQNLQFNENKECQGRKEGKQIWLQKEGWNERRKEVLKSEEVLRSKGLTTYVVGVF